VLEKGVFELIDVSVLKGWAFGSRLDGIQAVRLVHLLGRGALARV
jgi:hypothetical protein